MTWIVGIDEAGYGPTLGPLVIGATLWRIPAGNKTSDPFKEWSKTLEVDQVGPIRIDDSKKLYSTAHGLQLLEASVWGAIANLPITVNCFRSLIDFLTSELHLLNDPWYSDWEASATSVLQSTHLAGVCDSARNGWGKANVCLSHVAATILQPSEFNSLCDQRGNKAVVLTEQSLSLAQKMIQSTDGEPIEIFCDKHGGRNYYAAPLWHYWPEAQITIEKETRDHSRYRLVDRHGGLSIWNFTAKGDGYIPTALASMIAKYVRERMMEAFNAYWLRQLPGLKPTAGYPTDAQRFLEAIEPVRDRLGIKLEMLRRCR